MDTIDVPDLYKVYSVLYSGGNGPLWASTQLLRLALVVTAHIGPTTAVAGIVNPFGTFLKGFEVVC